MTEKKKYVDINNNETTMSKEMYYKQNEIKYVAFCLGYDLLNKMYSKSKANECDKVYSFSIYLATQFVESNYFENERKSTYDNLQEWLEDNMKIIQKEFSQYEKEGDLKNPIPEDCKKKNKERER